MQHVSQITNKAISVRIMPKAAPVNSDGVFSSDSAAGAGPRP
jgi:hypothetical protein